MIQFLINKIIKCILISLIWITIPIGIIYIPKISSELINLENQLQPYNVSVKGYYRNDGTYISSHKRRLPGSLNQDKPIKSKINKNKLLSKIIFLSIIISLGFFIWKIRRYIFCLRNEYETYLLNHIFLEFQNNLISELKYTYSKMLKEKVEYRWTFEKGNIKCKQCLEFIQKREFYLIKGFENICQNCLEKGNFNTISGFLYYINKFKKEYNQIESKFFEINLNKFPNYRLTMESFHNHLHYKIYSTTGK